MVSVWILSFIFEECNGCNIKSIRCYAGNVCCRITSKHFCSRKSAVSTRWWHNSYWTSMTAVQQLFGNRAISRSGDIHWPPRSSPDFLAYDFFFFGATLKVKFTPFVQQHFISRRREFQKKLFRFSGRCSRKSCKISTHDS